MGSPLFGVAIMVLSVIAVFILGLLLKKKLKLVRYLFWSLGCLLLIGMIFNSFAKNKMEREGEKEIVGVYKIDTNGSKFGSVNLKEYADLILTVKSNNTFNINRHTPFFKNLTGKWNLKDDGDISFIECSFDGDGKTFQIQNNNLWMFESYNLTGINADNRIVFKR